MQDGKVIADIDIKTSAENALDPNVVKVLLKHGFVSATSDSKLGEHALASSMSIPITVNTDKGNSQNNI